MKQNTGGQFHTVPRSARKRRKEKTVGGMQPKKKAERRQYEAEREAKRPKKKTNPKATQLRAARLKEMKEATRFWVEKYNSCGEKGAAAMLAKEAGMTYSQWQALPLSIRVQKRGEILQKKKFCLWKDDGI